MDSKENSGDEDTVAGDSEPISYLELYHLKMPPYFSNLPSLWFAQLDTLFHVGDITTDSIKFRYAIIQLKKYIKVDNILSDPIIQNSYERLKKELIERNSTELERMHYFLTHEKLGDRPPAQYLREMQQFAQSGVGVGSLKMPLTLQSHTSSIPSESTLENGAELADLTHDNITTPVEPAPSVSLSYDIATLTQRVQELTLRVISLSRSTLEELKSQSPYRSLYNRSQRTYNRYPSCWYHYRFGDRAKKCVKPCDYEEHRG